MGIDAIVRSLNRDEVPTFGRSRGWQVSYIRHILRGRSVIGEFQAHANDADGKRVAVGEPLVGYFPKIIPEDLYWRAQAAIDKRTIEGSGRKGKTYSSLFSRVANCGCGSGMHYSDRGSKGSAWLACDAADRKVGGCAAPA